MAWDSKLTKLDPRSLRALETDAKKGSKSDSKKGFENGFENGFGNGIQNNIEATKLETTKLNANELESTYFVHGMHGTTLVYIYICIYIYI